ncbi:MAG TPA: hypothetical protein VHR66_18890 [Gemmataceae bacterium]|jgi:hypothetical protein|nr:hypothetical protein [Gemmataceae bacterium]
MPRLKIVDDPISLLESITADAKAKREAVEANYREIDEWDKKSNATRERLCKLTLLMHQLPTTPPPAESSEWIAVVSPIITELAAVSECVGIDETLCQPWLYKDQKSSDEECRELQVVRYAVLAIIKNDGNANRACASIVDHVRAAESSEECWSFVRAAFERISEGASNDFELAAAAERQSRFGNAPCRVIPQIQRAPTGINCYPNDTPIRSVADARERLAVAAGFEADCRTVAEGLVEIRDKAMNAADSREVDALYQSERLRMLILQTPPLPDWGDYAAIDLIWPGEFIDHPRKAEALRRVAAFVSVTEERVDKVLLAVDSAYEYLVAEPLRDSFPRIQDAIEAFRSAACQCEALCVTIAGHLDRMEMSEAADLVRTPHQMMTAAEIAEELGISEDAANSRLQRLRKDQPDCYFQTPNPRQRESKYIYRREVIKVLKRGNS